MLDRHTFKPIVANVDKKQRNYLISFYIST